MSTLLYGMTRTPVPANEAEVRSTVTAVDADAPSAMADSAPDFNEVETDPDTEGGITSHSLASHVIPSERYTPAAGNANDNLFRQVNEQVSTSGTAAARESSGIWGHGTMKVVEGIEPTLRDGSQLGSEYFTAHPRPDAGSGNMMTAAATADPAARASAQAASEGASRQAVAGSMYAAMHAAFMGGSDNA